MARAKQSGHFLSALTGNDPVNALSAYRVLLLEEVKRLEDSGQTDQQVTTALLSTYSGAVEVVINGTLAVARWKAAKDLLDHTKACQLAKLRH